MGNNLEGNVPECSIYIYIIYTIIMYRQADIFLESILEFLGWMIRKILGSILGRFSELKYSGVDSGIGKYKIESAPQAKNSGVDSGVGFWGHSGVKFWGHEIKKKGMPQTIK